VIFRIHRIFAAVHDPLVIPRQLCGFESQNARVKRGLSRSCKPYAFDKIFESRDLIVAAGFVA
jgi:hypothetical protein